MSDESEKESGFSHVDEEGRARMVDVGEKAITRRIARAGALVSMRPETLAKIRDGSIEKGAVLATARLAGIMAAKRTSDLIPLCHPLAISKVTVDFEYRGASEIAVTAEVRVEGKTGVEMEALTACSVAGLTIYDMCKAIDREMVIGEVRLLHKSGGKSGDFDRDEAK